MEQFTGKVWILGDDIDTDIIIPTEYLALPTVEDMKTRTCRADSGRRYHCCWKEFWLWLLQRTGTGNYQGIKGQVCHCKVLRPYFL